MHYYKKTDENGNLTLIMTTVVLADEQAVEISENEFTELENNTAKENEHE